MGIQHISRSFGLYGADMNTSHHPTITICLNDGGRSQSKRKKQNNDCTVICTAIAFGLSYDDAFDIMQVQGRGNNKGIHFTSFLKDHPTKCHKIPPITPFPKYSCLRNEIEQMKQGTYIVLVKAHTYCVRNGVIHDCYPVDVWQEILSVWKVTDKMSMIDLL